MHSPSPRFLRRSNLERLLTRDRYSKLSIRSRTRSSVASTRLIISIRVWPISQLVFLEAKPGREYPLEPVLLSLRPGSTPAPNNPPTAGTPPRHARAKRAILVSLPSAKTSLSSSSSFSRSLKMAPQFSEPQASGRFQKGCSSLFHKLTKQIPNSHFHGSNPLHNRKAEGSALAAVSGPSRTRIPLGRPGMGGGVWGGIRGRDCSTWGQIEPLRVISSHSIQLQRHLLTVLVDEGA